MENNTEKLYNEYCEDWRSIIVDTWDEADALVDYMKSINHELVGTLKIGGCSSHGKSAVHVCEPMYTPRERRG